MAGLAASMETLVAELVKLPGIGLKTAERLAFHLLQRPKEEVQALARALVHVKEAIRFCETCFNLSDEAQCAICRDPRRNPGLLCVVEHPRDVLALEHAGGYRGRYHVLLGALSPLDGIGPKDLRIAALIERVRGGAFQEIILATDADTEGETTALYVAQQLRATRVKVTRMAQGLPMGSHVAYADHATLSRAMEGRREV